MSWIRLGGVAFWQWNYYKGGSGFDGGVIIV